MSKIDILNNGVPLAMDKTKNYVKQEDTTIAEISDKYSIIWQLNHPRTDSTYDNDYAWIDSIRAISNIAEANGTNVGDVQWQ